MVCAFNNQPLSNNYVKVNNVKICDGNTVASQSRALIARLHTSRLHAARRSVQQ